MEVSKTQQRTWDYASPSTSGLYRPLSMNVLMKYAGRESASRDTMYSCIALWIVVMEGMPPDVNLGSPKNNPSWYGFLVGYILEEQKDTGINIPSIPRKHIDNNLDIPTSTINLNAGRQAYLASKRDNYPRLS